MAEPQGTLTAVQHEILTLAWEAGDAGVAVTDVWKAIAGRRTVTRNTVLNLIDRLEKRGWLNRRPDGISFRYTAAVSREWADSKLASGFLQEFFGGSATQMVQRGAATAHDPLKQLRPGKYRLILNIPLKTGPANVAPVYWVGDIVTEPVEFEVTNKPATKSPE